VASHINNYFKINRQPHRKLTPWRVRFQIKPLKALGINLKDDEEAKKNWRIRYFPTKKEAESHGNSLVDLALRVNKGARSLPQNEKDQILELAAQLKEKWIDPLEALKLGGEQLRGRHYDSIRPLETYWEKFKRSRIENHKWSSRVKRQKEIFFENTKDHFLQHSLSEFKTQKQLAKAISAEISRFMEGGRRKAINTMQKHIAHLASFLGYVAHQADDPFVTPKLVKALFSEEGRLSVLNLPTGLEAEQANKKLTPEMAKVYAKEMAQLGPPYSTFMVLKLFAGQRTMNLWHWRWNWIDWDDRKITIPLKFTKNKTDQVEFGFDEIPNFAEWIGFVFEQTNPKPNDKLMTCSQPTLTKRSTRVFNQNSEIFTFGDGEMINGSRHVRNILRNSFVSYGVEAIGIAQTMRVVEDRHNLSSYLSSSTAGAGNNAKEFFSITPESLGLIPPLPVDGPLHRA
jgi:integrase